MAEESREIVGITIMVDTDQPDLDEFWDGLCDLCGNAGGDLFKKGRTNNDMVNFLIYLLGCNPGKYNDWDAEKRTFDSKRKEDTWKVILKILSEFDRINEYKRIREHFNRIYDYVDGWIRWCGDTKSSWNKAKDFVVM